MAHHKRHRPRLQRAGCFCGGKANKKFGRRATRGITATKWDYNERAHCCGGAIFGGSNGRELRLRERAREAA